MKRPRSTGMPPPSHAKDPPYLPALRVIVALLAVALLATLMLAGLDSCHHAGHV